MRVILQNLIAGNFSLMFFAFLQCSLLLSLYASGIISSIFVERSEYPFKQKDLARVLGEGRHRLLRWNSVDVKIYLAKYLLFNSPHFAVVD